MENSSVALNVDPAAWSRKEWKTYAASAIQACDDPKFCERVKHGDSFMEEQVEPQTSADQSPRDPRITQSICQLLRLLNCTNAHASYFLNETMISGSV